MKYSSVFTDLWLIESMEPKRSLKEDAQSERQVTRDAVLFSVTSG